MLTEIPQRHTLLYLSQSGREFLYQQRENVYPDFSSWEIVWRQFRSIPVITRRQVAPGSLIPVGVSLPVRQGGGRWRMASQVPFRDVIKTISAIKAAEMCVERPMVFSGLVEELIFQVPRYRAAVGIFGSAALEAVTGLAYCHADSDLDVVLLPQEGVDLLALGKLFQRLEEKWGFHIDGEVAIDENRYGKLSELLSGSNTILVKGGLTPVLCSTRSVLASLVSKRKPNLKK